MISERNNSSVLSKACIHGMINIEYCNYFIMTDQEEERFQIWTELLQVICPGNLFTS